MIIAGFMPESFVDWRGKMVATVFTYGCNFRCPFCHNHTLVIHPLKTRLSEEDILSKISELRGWIDGVCITGGEPTIHRDIVDFVREIRRMVPVKMDTNGTHPEILEELLNHVDYVAMDVKAPPSRYGELAGKEVNLKAIEESISLIKERAKDYEFRTTFVPVLKREDIAGIAEWIGPAKRYVLQQFSTAGGTLNPEFSHLKPHPREYLETTCESVKDKFGECIVANL